jgi:hypothetical protein
MEDTPMTYTYAVLEVSDATYEEIAKKLKAAGYDDVLGEDGELDMHGIAILAAILRDFL